MSAEPAHLFPGPSATRFVPNPYGRHGAPEGTNAQQAQSLALMCRQMTVDVVALLHTIVKGDHPDATVGDQLKAAQLVLDRGFGRAVSVVEMNVNHQSREIRTLSHEDLVRLANGEVLALPVTVEGRVVSGDETVVETVAARDECGND